MRLAALCVPSRVDASVPHYDRGFDIHGYQQASIRILLIAAVLVHLICLADWRSIQPQLLHVSEILRWYLALSLIIFLSFLLRPVVLIGRRVATLILDMSVTSAVALYGGEYVAPFFAVYMWLILGYGIRYGERYLYAGTALATVSFGFVLHLQPYWVEESFAGWGLLMCMAIIPLFVAILLRRSESDRRDTERANQAKTVFLENMSHEMRTPLTGIITVSEELQTSQINPGDFGRKLNTISLSAKLLRDLVDDTLDISRIEAGKMEVKLRGTNVYELLSTVVASMSPIVESKGLILTLDVSGSVPEYLLLDSIRVKQVLLNLLANSLKFTERGTISVIVSVNANTGCIGMQVKDSGIGIRAAQLDSVFENFVQLETGGRTTTQQGSGLGMAISRNLVELMCGSVRVESTYGKGTAFTIEIPMRETPVRQIELMDTPQFVVCSRELNLAEHVIAQGAELGFMCLPCDQHEGEFTDEEVVLQVHSVEALRSMRFRQSMRAGNDRVPIRFAGTVENPYSKEEIGNILRYFSIASGVLTPPDKSSDARPSFSRELHILLVDDSRIVQRAIRSLLEDAGAFVTSAFDGASALALLTAESGVSFDVAILDLRTPGITGEALLKKYQRFRGKHVPVIVLTANATDTAREACDKLDVAGFFTKPPNANDLIRCIERISND